MCCDSCRVVIPAYLDFVHNVESVFKSGVGENDFIKRIGHPVRGRISFESVPEIGIGIGNACVATQHDQACDGNEYQGDEFNESNRIRSPVGESGVEDNNQYRKRVASDS